MHFLIDSAAVGVLVPIYRNGTNSHPTKIKTCENRVDSFRLVPALWSVERIPVQNFASLRALRETIVSYT